MVHFLISRSFLRCLLAGLIPAIFVALLQACIRVVQHRPPLSEYSLLIPVFMFGAFALLYFFWKEGPRILRRG